VRPLDTPVGPAKALKDHANVWQPMGAWEWVIVSLVAFGLLQLLALRYAFRGKSAEGRTATPAPYAVDSHALARPEPDEGQKRCPHCGTENGPGYTYCRDCVGFLGP